MPDPTTQMSEAELPHIPLSEAIVPLGTRDQESVAVAMNVRGLPAKPAAVAVSVFVPAAGPRVQLPSAATPSLPEVALPPVIAPPPLETANMTA